MKKNYIAKIADFIKGLLTRETGRTEEKEKRSSEITLVACEADIDRYHNKGVDYLEKKKYDKAVEMFKKEIECDSGDFLGYWCLGHVYKEMGEMKEARRHYEIALSNALSKNDKYPGSVDKSILKEIKKDLAGIKGG